MPGHRICVTIIGVLGAAAALSGCGGDGSATSGTHACSLVSDATVAQAIGAEPSKQSDESVDEGGSSSNALSCRWVASENHPSLTIRVLAHKPSSTPTSDDAKCEPVDVTGVSGQVCAADDPDSRASVSAWWSNTYLYAELTVSSESPSAEQRRTGLNAVVADVKANLKPSDFDFKLTQ